jgi:hypothetical protein
MKYMVSVVLCVVMASCAWAQAGKGFEGAWTGTYTLGKKPPRTETVVFENVHDNTCTGFLWNGDRRPWTRCEVKGDEIAVWMNVPVQTPIYTGKILSPTQLELVFHAASNTQLYTFTATKQPPGYAKTLVAPTEVVPAGVDQSVMGIYRTLAELILVNVKKNDMQTAAKLSWVLENAWDRGETDLHSKSSETWRQVDFAMDEFIEPILAYEKGPSDRAKLETAYHNYLDKLKQAETAK